MIAFAPVEPPRDNLETAPATLAGPDQQPRRGFGGWLDRRRVLLWLGGMALGFAVVLTPWPGIKLGFSTAYCWVANHLLLSHTTFGSGGHARLRPATADELGKGQHVAQDAMLMLSVEGYLGTQTIGMNVRRDAYLPLAVFAVGVLASPLAWRRKGRCLGVGFAVTFALVLGCLWLAALSIFQRFLPLVLNLHPDDRSALEFITNAVLLPPDNRFLVPLALSIGLCLWQGQRQGAQVTRTRTVS